MPKKKKEYWIHKTKMKKGALKRQLGIPEDEGVPKTFLEEIRRTEIGKTATNPTQRGKKRIKVTRLLKKRAVLALTLRRFVE